MRVSKLEGQSLLTLHLSHGGSLTYSPHYSHRLAGPGMQPRYNESQVERLQAAAAARLHNFHGPKRQLLGKKAIPAPAWKGNRGTGASSTGEAVGESKGKEMGSKILLSKLPLDVTPTEVEVSILIFRSLNMSIYMFLVGIIQENSWAVEGFLFGV